MSTEAELIEEQHQVKRFKIQYPISDYTFPQEARIYTVSFDDEYLHVKLTDGRMLAVPLRWISTLYNASPGDPAKCAINDEVRLVDYLGPGGP
jgi:hypothetical protein